MKSKFLKQIQEKHLTINRAELILILEALELKKPQFELPDQQLQQRIHQRLDSFGSKKSLLLRVFDKQTNSKKVIEIFSIDDFQDEILMLIYYADQSKSLKDTETIMKVFDCYYLDQDLLFYAVEYENFDFSSLDLEYSSSTIPKFGLPRDVNQQLSKQASELEPYLQNIYAYAQQFLHPTQKKIESINLIGNSFFIFQKQTNGQIIVKLCLVDCFLFKESVTNLEYYYVTPTAISQQKPNLPYPSNFVKFSLNYYKAKEAFFQQIQKSSPQFLQQNRLVIEYIINNHSELDQFQLLSDHAEQDQFTIRGTSDQSQTVFMIKRFLLEEEANQQYEELQQLSQKFKNINLEVITNFELIKLGQDICLITQTQYSKINKKISLFNYFKVIETNSKPKQQGGFFGFGGLPNQIEEEKNEFADFTTTKQKSLNLIETLLKYYQILKNYSIEVSDFIVDKNCEFSVTIDSFNYFLRRNDNDTNYKYTVYCKYKELFSRLFAFFEDMFFTKNFLDTKKQIQLYSPFNSNTNRHATHKIFKQIVDYLFLIFQEDQQNEQELINKLENQFKVISKVIQFNSSVQGNLFGISPIDLNNFFLNQSGFTSGTLQAFQSILKNNFNFDIICINSQSLKGDTIISKSKQENKFGKNLYLETQSQIQPSIGFFSHQQMQQNNNTNFLFTLIEVQQLKLVSQEQKEQKIDSVLGNEDYNSFDQKLKTKVKNLVLEYINLFLEKDNNLDLFNNKYCSCLITQINQNIYYVVNQFLSYVVIQKMLSGDNDVEEDQSKFCNCSQLNQITKELIKNQVNLKLIRFSFFECDTVRQQIQIQKDYFGFGNNPNLLQVQFQKLLQQNLFLYLPYICKQLEQNARSLNTVILELPKRQLSKLYRLKRLVNIQYL